MTEEPLDELYLSRLIDEAGLSGGPYETLCAVLYTTPASYPESHPDFNRCEDGKYLRYSLVPLEGREDDWMDLECSVLELLLALSIRCEFQDETPRSEWFLYFIKNLGLCYSDEMLVSDYAQHELEFRVNLFLGKEISPFTRTEPQDPLWDQMAETLS